MSQPLTLGFGALSVVWAVRLFMEAGSPTSIWTILGVGWLVVGALACLGRAALSGAVALPVGLLQLLMPSTSTYAPLSLLMWIALAMLLCSDREHELATVLRWQVTTVYVFAALWKLTPTWLDGTQLHAIFARLPYGWAQLAASSSGLLVLLSVMAPIIEVAIALGLWFTRSRPLAAVVGLGFHCSLIVVASPTVRSATYVSVLNLGLVALYPAFFSRSAADHDRTRCSRANGGIAPPSGRAGRKHGRTA